MTTDEPYELVLTPPAVRAIQRQLPEAVATAVIEFLTGVKLENLSAWGSRFAVI